MSDERLLAFSRALSDSVRSGLPLADTLRSLSRASFRNRKLAAAADLVSQGKTMHESLSAQNLIPPLLIALIRAGEESGKIDAFLDRFSAALETRIDFYRRLRRALVYPAFAAALAGTIFVLFSTKAAPLLLQPLIDAGVAVPEGAQRTMRVGRLIVEHWPLILVVLLVIVTLLWAVSSSRAGRKARALAGHWLPGVRYATEEARIYQFEATMELLLGAGLRPRQMMEIMLQYFEDDPLIHRRLSRGALLLSQGKSFTESLGLCLPADDKVRVAVAEQAGRLDEAFGSLSKMHRDLHLHRLKQAATAVQISTIVALAPISFCLIMWILWPTLSLLNSASTQLPATGSSASAGNFGAMPSSPPVETSRAARFNELNAKKILGYMQEHAPVVADSDRAADSDAPPVKKKQLPMPKLKPMAPMHNPQFKKIESTTIKSSLN